MAGRGPEEPILNPRTAEKIIGLSEASDDQVNQAVAAARRAFPRWSRTTPGERSLLLLRLADRIEQQAETFAGLEALNCGKPFHIVLAEEIPAVVDCLRYFAGAARCLQGSAAGEYMEGHTSMVRRDPVGVIGSIAPWNYPLMMAAWKISPALAAGNTVVIKPSEQTPLTSLLLAEVAAEVLPAGFLTSSLAAEKVWAHHWSTTRTSTWSPDRRHRDGQEDSHQCGQGVKRTHLELGGKAPVIVYDDADLDEVVEGIRTFGYFNAGQDCTAACRIYAGAGIHDRLVEKLADAVSSIRYNQNDDDENEIPRSFQSVSGTGWPALWHVPRSNPTLMWL